MNKEHVVEKEGLKNHGLFEFGIAPSPEEHAAIQSWRLNNPDGFIINMKTKSKGMLHSVDCPHFGGTTWEVSGEGDLSSSRKYCSVDADFLQNWAEERDINLAYCSDCLEDDVEVEPSFVEPSGEFFKEPIATAEQFQKALLTLRDKKKLTPEHLEILKHMAAGPDKRTTATRLAQAMNLATYAAANLRMGLFAHLLADELSYVPPKGRGGKPMWWSTLASGQGGAPDSFDHHFNFTMRPELVQALINMRWIKERL